MTDNDIRNLQRKALACGDVETYDLCEQALADEDRAVSIRWHRPMTIAKARRLCAELAQEA